MLRRICDVCSVPSDCHCKSVCADVFNVYVWVCVGVYVCVCVCLCGVLAYVLEEATDMRACVCVCLCVCARIWA